jgi:hypothetical protein
MNWTATMAEALDPDADKVISDHMPLCIDRLRWGKSEVFGQHR